MLRSPATQTVIDAASGSPAELLERLGNVLYLGGALIFVVIMAIALYATYAKARTVDTRTWVVGGGIVFPVLVLSALLVYALTIGNAISAIDTSRGPGSGMLRVHVVGKQWWWEVRYQLPGTQDEIVLANELHVPVGQPVELLLTSTDVIHSFWVPSLAGKVDMIPGRTNRLVIHTDEAGHYRGQCAEYCGGQHALMAFDVVAESTDEFADWIELQKQDAGAPRNAQLGLGYDAFFLARCDTCHTVRGTAADGRLGPDLTHVGSRRSLAAGALDNHIGTMAGWIAGPQEVKPGNLMPATDVLSGVELRALSAWLGSLR